MTILEVENISKHFGGLKALDRVSFDLEEGGMLGLIGPNGSGKTTMFNVITGFLKPTSGSVTFCGQDITGYAPYKACKAGIARTFQLNRPFGNMTVLENVMVSLLNGQEPVKSLEQARADSEAILARTGLEEKRLAKAGTLSAVDQKRVELARALGARPKLLLLDEMMTGLNLREIEDAMKLIREVRNSGTTVIVVEHVMKAVLGLTDRVIVLSAGQKIFEGTPREVIHDKQVIEAYLGEREDA